MNLVELSLKNLSAENNRLALMIKEDFDPQLVVFIEKGGYIIGDDISQLLNAELIGIHAVRAGNKLKELIMPILSIMPRALCKWLRTLEMGSGVHKVSKDREVYFSRQISDDEIKKYTRILIVDDSVDTGYSAKLVKEKIMDTFINAKDVRLAALNVWDRSDEVIKTDYYLWKDTILMSPMSKDSKEYRAFLKIYSERKCE